jgi:hypothetical protein
MKLLKSWAALALLGTATPALAQEAFLRIDPGATRHVLSEGTVTTPSSSLPLPQAGTAHTNVHVFQPAGAPANSSPNARPEVTPFPGLFIETPQSIACVYRFVAAVPGCNPDKVTATLKGGSRTIIIVDAFHAPNALSDLQTFSTQFGLPVPMMPNGPSFQVVYADPSGAATGTPPPYNPGWEIEISLDIQWAHAMAPNANILLVEAASNLNAHLAAAVVLANTLVMGGGELSMSWGSPEFSTETSVDPIFMSPGIVYFASTGDSPNVVAIGFCQCGRGRRHHHFPRPDDGRSGRRGGLGRWWRRAERVRPEARLPSLCEEACQAQRARRARRRRGGKPPHRRLGLCQQRPWVERHAVAHRRRHQRLVAGGGGAREHRRPLQRLVRCRTRPVLRPQDVELHRHRGRHLRTERRILDRDRLGFLHRAGLAGEAAVTLRLPLRYG